MIFAGITLQSYGQAHGGLDTKAVQGRLARVGSWWSPAPEWEGRWWWNEGGGSAWVRADGLQAGPLVVYSGGEGVRTWSPGSWLTSGHWGVGLDQDSWGIWTVQRPENLESGAQLKGRWGPWTAAGSGDRTWLLDPGPNDVAWTDRGRVGLSYQSGGLSSGWESTTYLPVNGRSSWFEKGRLLVSRGPWMAGVKGSRLFGAPVTDKELWVLDTQGGWEHGRLGWQGSEGDSAGRTEGSWDDGRRGASLSWGPKKGTQAKAHASFEVWDLTLGVQGEADQAGRGCTHQEGVSAAGEAERGRWMVGWLVEFEKPVPTHTVTANWKEPSLEIEAKWKVQGFRLGWFGPGTTFDLGMSWIF